METGEAVSTMGIAARRGLLTACFRTRYILLDADMLLTLLAARKGRDAMVEMEVIRVQTSSKTYHRVVLGEKAGGSSLHIVIGPTEAKAIALAQDGEQAPRPLSYDMACSLLDRVGARILRVEITDLQKGIYYALVHIRGADDATVVLDSRPSDAIALALRAGVPIFAAAAILEQEGTEDDEGAAAEGEEIAAAVAALVEPEPEDETANPLDLLKQRMQEAIAEEAYEEAAQLRDRIADLGQREA